MAKTLEELEVDLRAVTTRLTVIDKIVKAADLGQEMILVFRCNHSGLYFPSDYIKEWGRLYGIGLGPDPVSEVLDTDYSISPPEITPDIRTPDQIMHPVGHCRVQVDMHLAPAEDIQYAIPAHEDPGMFERAKVIRSRQMVNPRSRLPMVMLAWDRVKKGAF